MLESCPPVHPESVPNGRARPTATKSSDFVRLPGFVLCNGSSHGLRIEVGIPTSPLPGCLKSNRYNDAYSGTILRRQLRQSCRAREKSQPGRPLFGLAWRGRLRRTRPGAGIEVRAGHRPALHGRVPPSSRSRTNKGAPFPRPGTEASPVPGCRGPSTGRLPARIWTRKRVRVTEAVLFLRRRTVDRTQKRHGATDFVASAAPWRRGNGGGSYTREAGVTCPSASSRSERRSLPAR